MAYEQAPGIDPETYLDELLAWRPPLPVGTRDIDELNLDPSSLGDAEPGYAWERLPRWLEEFEDAYKKVGIPIVAIDLCSSLPMHRALLSAHASERSAVRAREIAKSVFNQESLNDLAKLSPLLRSVAEAFARNQTARQLLISGLHHLLYTLTPDDVASPENLHTRAVEVLSMQKDIYAQDREAAGIERTWHLRFNLEETPGTYLETLAELPVSTKGAQEARQRLAANSLNEEDLAKARQTRPAGNDLAHEYFNWQLDHIMTAITPLERFRPARFLSLDNSRPEAIALSSLANAPETTQKLNLFSHALHSLFDEHQHIVGDIFQPLPVPDNSLTLITCFDGWPFHVQTPDDESDFETIGVELLKHWYMKLAYAGKIVVFPWAVAGDDPVKKAQLENITDEFGFQADMGVPIKRFSRKTLIGWMSESDRVTADTLSPIFNSPNRYFEALILTKPKKSLDKLGQVAARLAAEAAAAPEATG